MPQMPMDPNGVTSERSTEQPELPGAMLKAFEALQRREHELRLEPQIVEMRPTMRTVPLKAAPAFDDDALRKMLDRPPRLESKATERTDGRRVPIVLGLVRTADGATAGGIPVTLHDSDGGLLDRAATASSGLALLRFPLKPDGGPSTGTVRVAGGLLEREVTVAEGLQHEVADLVLDQLPEVPADVLPEDPFERLPSDFTPALALVIAQLQGATPDPILGRVAETGDFRGRRTPLVKRLTVPRLGPVPEGGGAPKRYLVRLRQEWRFLGYTLGELSEVEALDPGAIVREVTETVERARSSASESLDEVRSLVDSVARSTLAQASSIDSLLSVATSTATSTTASGFGSLGVGGGVGVGLVGGAVGGLLGPIAGALGFGGVGVAGGIGVSGEVGTRLGTSVLTTATTTNRVATSLHVNSLLQTAKSALDRTVRAASAQLRDVTARASGAVEQVSPLLSRVTNLLRWTMYENYVVTTHVEDVLEVQSVKITGARTSDAPVFSDEDIVEYRRFFEPALLDQTLRPSFDRLSRAVAERLAGGRPITVVHLAVDYSASVVGANLTVSIGGRERTLRLEPGGSVARTSLPVGGVMADALGDLGLHLRVRPPHIPFGGLLGVPFDQLLSSGQVAVSRVRCWFTGNTAIAPQQVEAVDSLRVTNASPTAGAGFDLEPPRISTDTSTDPLFRHVNRNATYYFGVLAQAALADPALRDDAPELESFRGDHALWRLPIVGFEGDRALVIGDPEPGDQAAKGFLADPGAATIVQLAAPGAYAEALQGLLALDLKPGEIHPSLLPPLPPTVPPLQVVDLAGREIRLPADDVVTPGG